jgi:hypothetical protein
MASPIYRFYEQRLLKRAMAAQGPRHAGLILDGNRRYRRRHNLVHPMQIPDVITL